MFFYPNSCELQNVYFIQLKSSTSSLPYWFCSRVFHFSLLSRFLSLSLFLNHVALLRRRKICCSVPEARFSDSLSLFLSFHFLTRMAIVALFERRKKFSSFLGAILSKNFLRFLERFSPFLPHSLFPRALSLPFIPKNFEKYKAPEFRSFFFLPNIFFN